MTTLSRLAIALALAALITTPAGASGYMNSGYLNGLSRNGYSLNGYSLNGFGLNSARQNGAASLDMTSFQPVRVIGIELPGDTTTR